MSALEKPTACPRLGAVPDQQLIEESIVVKIGRAVTGESGEVPPIARISNEGQPPALRVIHEMLGDAVGIEAGRLAALGVQDPPPAGIVEGVHQGGIPASRSLPASP